MFLGPSSRAMLCATERKPDFALLRENADKSDHYSVRLSEEYPPVALSAILENLRQIWVSCLLGSRQPGLKTLLPCLKPHKARAQRLIVGARVVFANESHRVFHRKGRARAQPAISRLSSLFDNLRRSAASAHDPPLSGSKAANARSARTRCSTSPVAGPPTDRV